MTISARLAPAILALAAVTMVPAEPRVSSAQPPSFEIIRVAQLDFLLRKGAKVPIIDVRSRQEYLARHIKGAISIPLDTIEVRAGEVPREGLVVLY
jgi:hypothetical protein